MIEIFVLIILLIFVLYILIALSKSLILFAINVLLIWLIFARFFIDWKKKEIRIYYLISALLAIFIFIFKDYLFLSYIFRFMSRALILEAVQILLLAFLLAHLLSWIDKSLKKIRK